MVLPTRIELVIHPYQGCVIPLNYRSLWCERWDSNPQAEAGDFKSPEFTDFSTLAFGLPGLTRTAI